MLPLSIAGRKPDEEWLEQLIQTVGLGDRRTHRPAELSGGQQQRVAVARALISKPAVVFADEPTGNLDSKASEEVLQLLRHSVDDFGQTVVMVTHDPEAASHADRLVVLRDGRVVHDAEAGTADQVIELMKSVAVTRAMTKVAVRGLAQRKLRALVTILAILLGVAFIAGSYVLTDTINRSFDDLFDEAFAGTDVAVSSSTTGQADSPDLPAFSERYLDRVRQRARRGEGGGRHLLARPLRRREGRPAQQQLRARVHQLDRAQAVPDAHLHRGPPAADLRRGLDRRVHGRSRGAPHRRHAPDRRPGRREGLPDRRPPAARQHLGRRRRAPRSSRCPRPSASPTSPASSTASRSRRRRACPRASCASGSTACCRRGSWWRPATRPPRARRRTSRTTSRSSAWCCSCSAAWRCWWAAS